MWTNFFVAGAGASAALAGLVIVAISVNPVRILQFPHMPARAATTVARLVLILVSSMTVLMPQPPRALGAEVIVFAIAAGMLEIRASKRAIRVRTEPSQGTFRIASS
jgi:hypothetical protein